MSTSDTIKNIQQDLTTLGRSLVTIGKAEAIAMAKKIGVGVALLVMAAYFGLNAISLFFMAGGFAFFLLLQPDSPTDGDYTIVTGALPLGFVIMGGVLLLLAGVLAGAGVASIKANQGLKQTQAETKATVEAVKGAIERGKADVAVRLEYGDEIEHSDLPAAQRGTIEQRPSDLR